MTRSLLQSARRSGGRSRSQGHALLALLACCLLLALTLAGCSAKRSAGEPSAAPAGGAGMGGAAVEVRVTQEALDTEPAAPDLSSPEAAVRSYLAWVSYAYRIGQSQVALPTMTSYQEVRVDSYLQYNLQQSRLVDQTLVSIVFGEPVADGNGTSLPARETWQYRYVSATDTGVVLGGPYEASYDATYTVVPNADGAWVVDRVEATSRGPVE